MKTCRDCVARLFGPCRDYCRAEREGLIEEARRSAERCGHALTDFVHVEGYPIWQASCIHCGRTASISLDPGPNEPDVYGEALTVHCPDTGEEVNRDGG